MYMYLKGCKFSPMGIINNLTRKKECKMKMIIKRGEIYYADLDKGIGSEQGGIRPVVIIQNNVGNKFSPTVIVASITSQMGKKKLPTHVYIKQDKLSKDSVVLLEQIRTLDKSRLKERVGYMSDVDMDRINKALLTSIGL